MVAQRQQPRQVHHAHNVVVIRSQPAAGGPVAHQVVRAMFRIDTAQQIVGGRRIIGAAAIAGHVCFYNEKVDIEIDGHPIERPRTKFS